MTHFATEVSDWQGTATFGDFLFDENQSVLHIDLSSGSHLRRALGDDQTGQPEQSIPLRLLPEDSVCPTRYVECSSLITDYCRWGCIKVHTNDCDNPESPKSNWPDLAEDIQIQLAGLGYACLGLAKELRVIVSGPVLLD